MTATAAAAACRSCSAQVFWAFTANGKRMLVNSVPVVGGNLRLEPNPGAAQVRVVAPKLRFGRALYVAHFATCPNARSHRKRGVS